MSPSEQDQVTQLLIRWSEGDSSAIELLTPLVYQELRRLAHKHIQHEREGHTLQTTALVHEAYLKLVDQKNTHWQNRAHFFAVSAQVMRHILVDYARNKRSAKRGKKAQKVTLEDGAVVARERTAELVALDEALQSLGEIHPRRSKVVELRYFGGMNNKEAAEVLKISEASIERDWRFAKAWLYRELQQQ